MVSLSRRTAKPAGGVLRRPTVGLLLARSGVSGVRAEHAAVAGKGPEQSPARRAAVEPLACVDRHRLVVRRAARRACKHRFEDHHRHIVRGRASAVDCKHFIPLFACNRTLSARWTVRMVRNQGIA